MNYVEAVTLCVCNATHEGYVPLDIVSEIRDGDKFGFKDSPPSFMEDKFLGLTVKKLKNEGAGVHPPETFKHYWVYRPQARPRRRHKMNALFSAPLPLP